MRSKRTKVYGGSDDGRSRLIVRATSGNAAREILASRGITVSAHRWREHFTETGNVVEETVAAREGEVFRCASTIGGSSKQYVRVEAVSVRHAPKDLVGKVARCVLSRPTVHGSRYGLVRRVTTKARGTAIASVTIQAIGLDVETCFAKTRSARYRGARFVVRGDELESVAVRIKSGRFVPLGEWFAGEYSKQPTTKRETA